LIVHPGAGNRKGTLVNGLLYYCKTLSGINGVLRPGIVHRLDKNTSGLLVVAKNDTSHLKLSRQFESKAITRTYNAIVWGVPSDKTGEINTQIGRSRRDRKKMTVLKERGREAITRFRIIKDYVFLAHLEVNLGTGRTHQIRVHLNYLNHPVFGDPDYNGRKSQINRLPSHLQKRGMGLLKMIDRQALHAKTLEFIHPRTNAKMVFDSNLPGDIRGILDKIPDTLMI
jgi:23S rRNA pseudouridine1911/1915/1917 synthase